MRMKIGKGWKKLQFLICILMVFILAVIPITGMETKAQGSTDVNKQNSYTLTYVNPLYGDNITEDFIERQASDNIVPFTETSYCDNVSEAGEQVRAQLKKRVETIRIGLKSEEEPSSEILKQVFNEALKHTGNATEGDYLKWQYGGWKANVSYYGQGKTYYLTLTYNVSYYTNQIQEREVDSVVSGLLDQLDLKGKNDYEKVETIYDFICSNVAYDFDHLNDTSYMQKFTAYAALIDKKAVCQGYAVLFYRLALEEGIDARVISGSGNGGAHAWNIVKIGTKYYNLDTTWDAGRSTYSYFLKGKRNFTDHIVDTYSAEIINNYMISDTDFDPKVT